MYCVLDVSCHDGERKRKTRAVRFLDACRANEEEIKRRRQMLWLAEYKWATELRRYPGNLSIALVASIV